MDEYDDDCRSPDDSEDERDLEIALYSQIHFDPVPDETGAKNYDINIQNPQYCVGIKEVSLPLNTVSMEKSSNGENYVVCLSSDNEANLIVNYHAVDSTTGGTICITSSDEDDCVEFVTSQTQCVRRSQFVSAGELIETRTSDINERRMFNNENKKKMMSVDKLLSPNDHVTWEKRIEPSFVVDSSAKSYNKKVVESESDVILCDEAEDFNFDADDVVILDAYSHLEDSLPPKMNSGKPHLLPHEGINLASGSAVNIGDRTPPKSSDYYHKVTEKENDCTRTAILPFSITRAPVNVEKDFESEESDFIEDKAASKTVSSKANLIKKKQFILSSKKEGFLSFSKTDHKKNDTNFIKLKKKKISKQEAAVRPRKPQVVLRKAPFVKVSYQQDSDTNTDYSDSDMSQTSTPKKSRRSDRGKSATEDSTCKTSTSKLEDTSLNSASAPRRNCGKEKNFSKKNYMNDVKNKNTMEESDSESNSEDMQKDIVANPALDFNVQGGVDALLKSGFESTEGEKWQISDQDRYQILMTTSRYFSPSSFTCRNCNGEGHKAVNCPEPKKSTCIFCGMLGHIYQRCPNSICYNCNAPGHRISECRERHRSRKTECDRCWMPGHFEEDCPDIWRQYHHTCSADGGKIQRSEKSENPKVFCFNCGQQGHFGYECKETMMNIHIFPNYPFIAKYDRHKLDRDRKGKKDMLLKKRKKLGYDKHFSENREDESWEHRKEGSRERRREHRKKEVLKRKEMESKAKTSKVKDTSHKEESRKSSKKGGNKKHHENLKTNKSNLERDYNDNPLGNEKRLKRHDSSERIETGTTVFSFQNPTSNDYSERSYGFPNERSFMDMSDENLGTHRSNADQSYSSNRRLRKGSRKGDQPQHDPSYEDEMTHHQVFDNEWWKEDNNTKHKKKGKSTKRSSGSKKHASDTGNHNVPPQHQMKKRKITENYETQSREVSFHGWQQNDLNPREDNLKRHHQHRTFNQSGIKGYDKRKKKCGFQMNSFFQSLSRSCQNL